MDIFNSWLTPYLYVLFSLIIGVCIVIIFLCIYRYLCNAENPADYVYTIDERTKLRTKHNVYNYYIDNL